MAENGPSKKAHRQRSMIRDVMDDTDRTTSASILNLEREALSLRRKRAEYCFESTVSEKNSLSFLANSVSSGKNLVSSLLHTHLK